MALTIDLTAGNRTVSDEDFRHWASSQSLFLSSVMREFKEARPILAAALEDAGFTVRWFEEFGGTDDSPDSAYLTEVAGADIYVGVIGDEYGAMQRSGYSATHEEYLEARRRGRRVTFWVKSDDANRQGHARDFVSEVRVFNVTGGYVETEDLVRRLLRRLREMAAEDISPWVKLGDIVFRAECITDVGSDLTIDALVRDPNVMHALRATAPGAQRRVGEKVPITYRDRSGVGHVVGMEVQTEAQTAQRVTMHLGVQWPSGRPSMAVSTGGFSPDDLVEVGIRAGMLEEVVPPALTGLGMGVGAFVDTTDPLAPLEGVQLLEGSIQSVARLLAVEHLVGSQRVASIEDFVLGPAVQGRRRLRIAWREYPQYTNRPAGRRQAEGDRSWH